MGLFNERLCSLFISQHRDIPSRPIILIITWAEYLPVYLLWYTLPSPDSDISYSYERSTALFIPQSVPLQDSLVNSGGEALFKLQDLHSAILRKTGRQRECGRVPETEVMTRVSERALWICEYASLLLARSCVSCCCGASWAGSCPSEAT